MKTIGIAVKGKVQGVYFRQSTRDEALALGITGTVQNEPDGSVSIVATGEEHVLQQLIQWCHRGPLRAKVASVEVKPMPFTPFEAFTVVRK